MFESRRVDVDDAVANLRRAAAAIGAKTAFVASDSAAHMAALTDAAEMMGLEAVTNPFETRVDGPTTSNLMDQLRPRVCGRWPAAEAAGRERRGRDG